METHYHSQFDNDGFYDERVYRLHHELFALLLLVLDETAVVPLQFARVAERVLSGIDKCREVLEREEITAALKGRKEELVRELERAESIYRGKVEKYREENAQVRRPNRTYRELLHGNQPEEAEKLYRESREQEKKLLARFLEEQNTFVRIDWYGNVLYPHEIIAQNLQLLCGAAAKLEENQLSSALRKLYQVDNNAYAFMFERKVYEHFTDYVFHQPKERLKWGYGRLLEHENLYELVQGLLKKEKAGEEEFAGETKKLKEAGIRQGEKLLAFLKKLPEEK